MVTRRQSKPNGSLDCKANISARGCACCQLRLPEAQGRGFHRFGGDRANSELSGWCRNQKKRIEIDSSQKATCLVYGGQLSEHKGVLILLDAFDELAESRPHIELILAGALPGVKIETRNRVMRRLEEAKRRWGDRVRYVGHVERVTDLFTANTIHVCPSIWDDPSPNIVAEAKAKGTPTIAFNRGGIPELIRSGVDGEIVDTENAVVLANAIAPLLESPDKFQRYRLAASASIDRLFDGPLYAQKWLSTIDRAMAKRSKRSARQVTSKQRESVVINVSNGPHVRVAIVAGHPVQYYTPLFRELARYVDLHVYYGQVGDRSQQALAGFGIEFEWDIDLMLGYSSTILVNVSKTPSVTEFAGCDVPTIRYELAAGKFDAVIVFGWYQKFLMQAVFAANRLGIPVLVRGDSQLYTPRSLIKRVAKGASSGHTAQPSPTSTKSRPSAPCSKARSC